jgi:hypothetical protein
MENRFFSVRQGVRINGVTYRPGMCYPVNGTALGRTVAALIENGDATGYPQEVRFVTGRPVPVKKAGAEDKKATKARVQGQRINVSSSASRAGGKRG